MASIKETGSLKGSISATCSLSGGVSTPKKAEEYSGEYQITPQAFTGQVLQTANKLCTKNITVDAVPYYEVSNLSDGKTAYIASEV